MLHAALTQVFIIVELTRGKNMKPRRIVPLIIYTLLSCAMLGNPTTAEAANPTNPTKYLFLNLCYDGDNPDNPDPSTLADNVIPFVHDQFGGANQMSALKVGVSKIYYPGAFVDHPSSGIGIAAA